MSIFRVEKNSNYTVISNYHLRDKNLSLKTIGLLSIILSLPEDWDYTQAGLAAICKDGIDSVRAGLKELEENGYLEKERVRDEKGRVKGTDYRIFEMPKAKRVASKGTESNGIEEKAPNSEIPKQGGPILENPILEKPKQATPILEKQPQINKDIPSKDSQNTDLTNLSIYHDDGPMDGISARDKRKALVSIIRENIGYKLFERKVDILDEQLNKNEINLFDYDNALLSYNLRIVDNVIDYMIDILLSLNDDPIKIGGELISRNLVKAKLHKVDFIKMKKVVFELSTNNTIKNPKKYAISMLYNA